MTYGFIADYSAQVFPVVTVEALIADMWATPGFAETKGLDGGAVLTFEQMVQIKGRSPSRKMQFCTEKLKLVPQRRWMKQAFGPNGEYAGWDYIRYAGIRRDESAPRRKAEAHQWSEYFDCQLVYPIVDWTKQQCFDYVLAAGEPINPLYALGFDRVGCAPCINSSKGDILNWLCREPAMIDKVRRLEVSTGRTFFAPCVPGLHINNIDQVIEWAKTSHGGRQTLLPIMHDRHACESKWGLCE